MRAAKEVGLEEVRFVEQPLPGPNYTARAGEASAAALRNLDVKGKIVLTSGPPQAAVENAVRAKGALGVVTYEPSEDKSPLDAPDQIGWSRIDVNTPARRRDTFRFVLPP